MASGVKYPIRLKILLLMVALVLAATGAYLALAVKMFKDDKKSLVYEMNASTVKTLAAQTDSTLQKIADKVKLLTQGHVDADWARAIFEAEPDLIAYTLYQADGSEWRSVTTIRNSEYLKLYGLETSEVEKLRERFPVPFAEAFSHGSLAYSSTAQGGAPILTLAFGVQIVSSSVPHVAVADIRMDRILKLLSGKGIAKTYIVDAAGRVVAHPDPELMVAGKSFTDVPIVKAAIESPVALQLKTFEWQGSQWIGAYGSVGIGKLAVVSQVEEKQAFRAARKLVEKSLLFAAIVVTAAALISGWLARSFTLPLNKLLAATERLSRWEFGSNIHVSTKDEIAALARSFNSMASDLQSQRARIEAHQAELELKVKERTHALEGQKKQVLEAQDALLRTTRLASLGELAGVAAHEVLNPVNNMNVRVERNRAQLTKLADDLKLASEITAAWQDAFRKGGWAELEKELRKPASNPAQLMLEEDLENLAGVAKDALASVSERRADIEFISQEIFRVTRIINNMRSLSRVGGERRPIDVHVPLEDTRATLSDLFEKRKVAFIQDYSADSRDDFAVIADKDELVQVFSNLVRNALHAIDSAKRRSPEIRVTTKRNGDRVEVRIVDNGTGIARENLPRLFEPSFTTKSVEEGTGLGLSISRRLVRAFAGDLEVESTREGEGTTFLVWFPAANSVGTLSN